MKLTETAKEFQAMIGRLAAVAGQSPEDVYALWEQYEADCRAADQSAVASEFIQWNEVQLGGNVDALRDAIDARHDEAGNAGCDRCGVNDQAENSHECTDCANQGAATVEPTPEPEKPQKWQADASNPPGKVQVGRLNKALQTLSGEHHYTIEKSGIIGKTDGYDAEREFATQHYTICGENKLRPEVTAAQVAIGKKYGWTVSRDNAKDIVADIEAAMPALKAARKVEDKRQTQEQADAEKAQRIADNQKHDADVNARNQELRNLFVRHYGEPGATFEDRKDRVAICAVLCFDNSHYQSDYFDTHAQLGVPLLLAWHSGAETQAAALSAAARYPALSIEQHGWTWKTEKYSGGHGNYLTGSGVDIPAEIGATRKCYGGGDIKRGHWEIQFKHYCQDGEWSAFKGYTDAPSVEDSGQSGCNQRAGGALGTVARNLEHDGVEIAFTDKPSDDLRWRLKRAGFRITRRPPWKWYQKFSAAAWSRACELAGVNIPCPSSDPAGGYVQAQEDAYFDNQAAAIGA